MEKLMTVIAVIGIVFVMACGESEKVEEPSTTAEHSDVVSEDATQETGTATCATCTDISNRKMERLQAWENLCEQNEDCIDKRMAAKEVRRDLDEIRIGYISDESDEDEIRSTVMDRIIMDAEMTANTACLQAVLAEMHFQEVSRPTPDELKARRMIKKIIREMHATEPAGEEFASKLEALDLRIEALDLRIETLGQRLETLN